jgi:hypothetical protein
MEVVVSRLATMHEIVARHWTTTFTDPLQERWFLVPLGPLEITVSGRYEAALLADGELITRSVVQITGEKQ